MRSSTMLMTLMGLAGTMLVACGSGGGEGSGSDTDLATASAENRAAAAAALASADNAAPQQFATARTAHGHHTRFKFGGAKRGRR